MTLLNFASSLFGMIATSGLVYVFWALSRGWSIVPDGNNGVELWGAMGIFILTLAATLFNLRKIFERQE